MLDYILNGYRLPLTDSITRSQIPYKCLSPKEKQKMQIAFNNLLELGAISKCKNSSDQFLSPTFLIPKPNGKDRFILNLKYFNKFITNEHFKMEDYRSVCTLLSENCYIASIDLKESYLLVPIHPEHKKYLRFQIENDKQDLVTFEFNAMPYGLSSAPRTFTKIMKEVIGYLRKRGFSSVTYLDDTLCIGDSYEKCLLNVTETVKILECLGFIINYEKSVLEPRRSCKFLGYMFNTENMTIFLPENKQIQILHLVQKFKKLQKCTIREFSQFIGVLTAACPAMRYSWLYTKQFEREKYLALLKCNNNYDAFMELSSNILPDLTWWERNILVSRNYITPQTYKLEIFTDASRSGWGAVCNNERANGQWKESELKYHINYLELQAAFFGLKCFAPNMTNCAILMRIDNTTAISYINRMGGIQFPHLNDLTRSIWKWCEERNLWLFASYINTRDNKEADTESRRVNPDTEIQLCTSSFLEITEKFGEPEIDLFASRTNAKCRVYVSWKPDPDALSVDAFTISWKKYYFYCFPPFAIIQKCLQKIVSEQSTGIFVFPYWPTQVWFPLLSNIIISDIIFLKNSIRSDYRIHLPVQTTLAAAIVSGKHSQNKEFHR